MPPSTSLIGSRSVDVDVSVGVDVDVDVSVDDDVGVGIPYRRPSAVQIIFLSMPTTPSSS